ncbi:MAG: zinc-dependent alcohol dehydrogenase family protein [Bdellovibrionota bacterium]
MLQVTCGELGEPASVLKLENVAEPIPKKSELAIQISARPINPSDLLTIRGSYGRPRVPPFVPGYEGVGVVVGVGEGGRRDWLGRRVLALGGGGTWQEAVTIPEATALRIPDEIDDLQACQLYINSLSAWLMLDHSLRAKPGDWVLANAANSSVGRVLCQLSRILRLRLIAVVDRSDCAEELLSLGADSVVNATQRSVADFVRERVGPVGVHYVLDAVGGTMSGNCLACLRDGGKFVSYGTISKEAPRLDFRFVREKKIEASFFLLSNWPLSALVNEADGAFGKMIAWVKKGDIRLNHGKVFGLAQYREAVLEAETRGKAGKVLLV